MGASFHSCESWRGDGAEGYDDRNRGNGGSCGDGGGDYGDDNDGGAGLV